MNVGLQFLSVTWTERVPDNEAVMILREIHSALRQALRYMPDPDPVSLVSLPEVKPYGYWVLQDSTPGQAYGSVKWYIDQSYDAENQRLLAWQYLDLVRNEPYQFYTPHYDLTFAHFPLYDERAHQEAIGVEIPGHAAVVSTSPLNRLPVRHERPLVLHRIVAHYVGRVIGIPYIRAGEPGGCSGPCVMRPAATLDEWLALAQEETLTNVTYCERCRRQLAAKIASNQLGAN